MTQVELALPPAPPLRDDPVGFQIGWDHAHHGLVPPPEWLLEATPIGQGWRAARAVLAGRVWPAHRCTRQWLALRLEAWRNGAAFDLQTVTPGHLAQIEVRLCPVLRLPLGGASPAPGAARIARLDPQAAYTAGNLVMLSEAADRAWQGLGVLDLERCARAAEATERLARGFAAGPAVPAVTTTGDDPARTPDAAAWWRLAALRSLATPLHAAEAARLPLAVTPPPRVRLLNAVQALQALLTARLAGADWSAQMAAVAAQLSAHDLRIDFNLWVGALAPRVLEAQAQGRDIALALEDAWLAERVQRRWQHFALALGTLGCEQWVQRLAVRQPGGRTARTPGFGPATEGWALPRATRITTDGLDVSTDVSAAPGAAPPPAIARRSGHRRTARSPFVPPSRATADRQSAAT
jgi:hypothetical protein